MIVHRVSPALWSLLLGGSLWAQGIAWEPSWEAATKRSKEEGKVLFLAVNMDGERANDHLAKKTYKDRGVVALSRLTVNAVASRFDHRGGSRCPRFGAISCAAHQAIDRSVRAGVLKANAEGYVVAPQHIWLDPAGKVLLSVPYEVSVEELSWCFVTALRAHDANSAVAMPKGAHPPRRLIMAGLADPEQAASQSAPLSREEALALIEELKKGGTGRRGGWRKRFVQIYRLIRADEPEAIEFTRQMFKSGLMSRRGGELIKTAIRTIGDVSPRSYWVILAEQAKHSDDGVRAEVAVALEQLGAEKSLRTIKAALRVEKVLAVKKNWLRALGTAGARDRGAHRTLLKAARARGPAALRLNAEIALGWLVDDPKVREYLLATLRSPLPQERKAIALAMAISRDKGYGEALEAAVREEKDEEVRAVLEASLKVVRGENLGAIAAMVSAVAGDEIPRARLFGGGSK